MVMRSFAALAMLLIFSFADCIFDISFVSTIYDSVFCVNGTFWVVLTSYIVAIDEYSSNRGKQICGRTPRWLLPHGMHAA